AFGHQADEKFGTEVVVELAQGGDEVDDGRRSGVLEVGVAGVDGERGTFEIDVNAVEPVFADDACDGGDEVGHTLGVCQGEVLPSAAERDHDLLALTLEPGDVGFVLRGVEAGRGG